MCYHLVSGPYQEDPPCAAKQRTSGLSSASEPGAALAAKDP